MPNFQPSFEYKLIYVFRINDDKHNGCLKIGDATINTDKTYNDLLPNSHDLNVAAKKRIDEYTRTAGIVYELLYTELAVKITNYDSHDSKSNLFAFRDYDVHSVLKRSNIHNIHFDTNKTQNEWFECDLETAKNAIKAVKEGKSSLDLEQISTDKNPIIFRPEQKDAIEKTLKQLKKSDRMLWNAKMRFGKTLTALEVVKRSNFSKTIIITHRPVVSSSWYEDFNKIFYDCDNYEFGSKMCGKSIEDLINSNKKFVYFASMQDLRGSEQVGGSFDKNNIIFKINWDFVVVDEAHEGTKTKLGQSVLQAIVKTDDKTHLTKTLELSGTPFNLLVDYKENEIYTWDYIMEQEAKKEWIINHYGDSNPYEELPKMNIFTYHLEEKIKNYTDIEDKAFNFREFFRTWTGNIDKDYEDMPENASIGDFIHQSDVELFLNLICHQSDETNYPFSTDLYRKYFRHTLWVLPGVKEAKAFSKLLRSHPIFSRFEIINVAGNGDEEIDSNNALDAVKKAIGQYPEETYTITLSCGRLTTGVSVPEWTAVLMLAGSFSTQAGQYLQTIFRVQTPANIDGKTKENCYVFDFAPDRALKMIAESVQLSSRNSNVQKIQLRLEKFLNFCPVISISDSNMKEYKVNYLLQELKKAYAERVARNGFDDTKLYNDELLKLNEIDLKEFDRLKRIIGSTPNQEKTKTIDINNEGFTEEEYETIKNIENKPKKELTEEDKQKLGELKKKRKEKEVAISILRGISIRIPLLVYGADVPINKDITIEEFPSLVDDVSWEEFMPKGVTKKDFELFSKYYDKDIFVASTFRIRSIAKAADELEPTERIKKIAQLFSTFKNPDKETILTPWRVVNMHLSETIGGYCFYDESFNNEIASPRKVDIDNVTDIIFSKEGKVLEINSKTGLYPLYVVYSFYREFCKSIDEHELTFEKKKSIWNKVMENNIYVICKTPMAKQITRRTLLGYTSGQVNAHAFDDLITQMKDKQNQLIKKIKTPSFWNKGGTEMKFNAIVGNPPYQLKLNNNEDQQNVTSIYHLFLLASLKIKPDYISLIMPSRWMTGGRGLDEFRKQMLEMNNFLIMHDHLDARDCFTNVEIKGGICYFLCSPSFNGKCDYYLHLRDKIEHSIRKLDSLDVGMVIRDSRAFSIVNKVIQSSDFKSFESIAGSQTPFGIVTSFKDYTLEPTNENTMKIYGNKFIGYTSTKNILKNKELAYKFKVFVPKAIGDGILATDKIKPIVPDNPSICTQTYIVYGGFETRDEAENLAGYMRTKFFHFLLGQLKNTQQMSPSMFKLVPLLDFKEKWNDNKLYEKYHLSNEEISFINESVWPKER